MLGIGFILYTLAGGMTAVGYTNIMHLCAMYGGVFCCHVCYLKGWRLSAGPSAIARQLFQFYDNRYTQSLIMLIASILGACTAQAGIQPILAAKDVHVAKKSAIITACVVAPFGIFTALLGMAAKNQI